jgi:hypothetical protein
MTDWYSDVAEILASLGLPYYHGMPQLTSRPGKYMVYDLYDVPDCYAEDEEQADHVTATVSVITGAADPALYRRVRQAMKNAGWMYGGGRDAENADIFPPTVRHIMEFTKSYERE